MATKTRKQHAYHFGLFAETIAVLHYLMRGYRTIARRYKTSHGEIDLIVKRGQMIAFVEVKARSRNDTNEVLTTFQQRRITNAASLFIARKPKFANFTMRFDVLIIKPWTKPIYIPHAWEA